MLEKIFVLENPVATEKIATKIANAITSDFVVVLEGELGAGKTTLIRNILQNWGIKDTIKSPTFTLVETYLKNSSKKIEDEAVKIHHFDLYRFGSKEEWFDAGFDEYFLENSICFIEWAKRALTLIPQIDWELKLTIADNPETKRILSIKTTTKKGKMCLEHLMKQDEI